MHCSFPRTLVVDWYLHVGRGTCDVGSCKDVSSGSDEVGDGECGIGGVVDDE